LEKLGLNTRTLPEEKPGQGVLSGKTVLFTGTLQRLGREQAKEVVERHGGRNLSAVSANLQILVVGEKAGSKLKKAQEIGSIDVMTEDEFLALVGENG
jgi:DNA ligase (NAD+)